jgi:NAD-dependent SIR2 family protein deacetylase
MKGMSIPAGIDYTDEESFKKRFPGMLKYGVKKSYDLIGFNKWESEELKWGYLCQHGKHMRYDDKKDDTYQNLYELVKDKNYFVITSNVDQMFLRNNFDKDRIYTPQGDYGILQCMEPCSEDSYWDAKKTIFDICEQTDKDTHILGKKELIPKCPNCGGKAFFNLNGGKFYLHSPHEKGEKNFINFIKNCQEESDKKKLLIIEIGAGYNTPSVIRFRMSNLAYNINNSNLIRVNLQYPEVEEEIEETSFGISDDAKSFIENIKKLIMKKIIIK